MIGGLSFMNQYTLLSFGIGRCNRQTCDTPTLGSGKFAIREIVCFSWGGFFFSFFFFFTFFSFSFFSFELYLLLYIN
jgi:hypothetical protein